MQLKDEPEGFIKAMAKQKTIEHLNNARANLIAAERALCMPPLNHQIGEQLVIGYQKGIKQLIVEISQLYPPAEASPAPAKCSSDFESQSCPEPCSARQWPDVIR